MNKKKPPQGRQPFYIKIILLTLSYTHDLDRNVIIAPTHLNLQETHTPENHSSYRSNLYRFSAVNSKE